MTAAVTLTERIARHLDPHLAQQLLTHAIVQNEGDRDVLFGTRYDLARRSGMVDYAESIDKEWHGKVTTDLSKERQATVKKLADMQEQIKPVLAVLQNPEVMTQLKSDKLQNMQILMQKHSFKIEYLDLLLQYAKLQYETGAYNTSAETLHHFLMLSSDAEKNLLALWGKLAAEIQLNNFETAVEEAQRLREMLDGKTSLSSLQILQQRLWLMHWSLFILAKHPKAREVVVDLFFQPANMNAIQTGAPHLLRYIVVAVLTSKRRRSHLKELVKIVQQESYQYSDAVTDLINALYGDVDFDAATQFLSKSKQAEFMESAQTLLLEAYARVHQSLKVDKLTQMMQLPAGEEGERWILGVLRAARMDFAHNADKKTIEMTAHHGPVPAQIIERANELRQRTANLFASLDKALVSAQ